MRELYCFSIFRLISLASHKTRHKKALPRDLEGARTLGAILQLYNPGTSLRSKRFRRVWEQRKTEKRGFRYFACAENGARAKKKTVGVGEGKEGTACGQTPGF